MPFDSQMPDMSFETASARTKKLTPKQKAAVVVRLLLSEGAVPALSSLPESKQTELAIQLARMAPVDQATVAAVAEEFANAIESIGLSFPAGLDGALGLLDGVISSSASSRLRKMSPKSYQGDPWERIGAVEAARLVQVLERESNEVAAVILSKLKVSKAAEILGLIPGERARRITYGVSLTGSVAPDVVYRIGVSLAEELETRPALAFADGPVTRVGAILNYAPGSVRDAILEGLEQEDSGFASEVRQAIFTFVPTGVVEEAPCAESIVRRLARQAYRRPVTDEDVRLLMGDHLMRRRQQANRLQGVVGAWSNDQWKWMGT